MGLELVHAGVAFLAHFACGGVLPLVMMFGLGVSRFHQVTPHRRRTFARLLRSPSALVAMCYRAAMASEIRLGCCAPVLTGAMLCR